MSAYTVAHARRTTNHYRISIYGDAHPEEIITTTITWKKPRALRPRRVQIWSSPSENKSSASPVQVVVDATRDECVATQSNSSTESYTTLDIIGHELMSLGPR